MARLFQPSAKSGLRWMILVKVSTARRAVAAAHLLDARLQQPVDLLVAGAAPHLPDRVLGENAHHLVRSVRAAQQRGVGGTPTSPAGRALAAAVHVLALDQAVQGLLARDGPASAARAAGPAGHEQRQEPAPRRFTTGPPG